MFGHHAKRRPAEGQELDVDTNLERDISAVEWSVERYLQDPTDSPRQDLLAALNRLDDQIDLSDAYETNIFGSGAFGYASKGSVVGETSNNPITEEVVSTEFQAQVALVKAPKAEVTGPTPDALAALHTASEALATVRAQAQAAN